MKKADVKQKMEFFKKTCKKVLTIYGEDDIISKSLR